MLGRTAIVDERSEPSSGQTTSDHRTVVQKHSLSDNLSKDDALLPENPKAENEAAFSAEEPAISFERGAWLLGCLDEGVLRSLLVRFEANARDPMLAPLTAEEVDPKQVRGLVEG